jgi:hypothetical protein
LAVRDPVIATQRSRRSFDCIQIELAKQHEKYTIQDPGTASQELAKWQETYATRDPETAKHKNRKIETKVTVKLIARGKNRRSGQTVLNLGNQ